MLQLWLILDCEERKVETRRGHQVRRMLKIILIRRRRQADFRWILKHQIVNETLGKTQFNRYNFRQKYSANFVDREVPSNKNEKKKFINLLKNDAEPFMVNFAFQEFQLFDFETTVAQDIDISVWQSVGTFTGQICPHHTCTMKW